MDLKSKTDKELRELLEEENKELKKQLNGWKDKYEHEKYRQTIQPMRLSAERDALKEREGKK